MIRFVLSLVILILVSCVNKVTIEETVCEEGQWRGELKITQEETLPFHFNLQYNEGNYVCEFINGSERIRAEKVHQYGDSLFIEMPVFNSEFSLSISSSNLLVGTWKNLNKGPDYSIPFKAKHGTEPRFLIPKNPIFEPLENDKWEVVFSPNTTDASPALGVFSYEKTGRVTGTFATEKGDFRFLEGLYCDSMLHLSCFDGAHAFLFKAKMNASGSLSGSFWSGSHWHEEWVASPNSLFALSNPDSLSRLVVDGKDLNFTFPDLDGNPVSLKSDKYTGKPVIIQVLGSWCPNCADESLLFQELYSSYHHDGLEIIGLCFEGTRNQEMAIERIDKFRNNLNLEYDLLLAGYANKREASETLAFLDSITSFPTSIILDKDRNIRKVHTGFYGPGTGQMYSAYKSELLGLVKDITSN